jgi:hypothetical protein
MIRSQQPFAVSGVTAEQINAALHAAGCIGAATRLIALEPTSVDGFGIVGTVCRLKFRYTGPAGPATAVLKRPAVEFSESATFARAEARWYREDMPYRSGIRAPQVLAEGERDENWLLLEDLGDAGFVRQHAGCTPAQAAIALDEIAALHARWWQGDTAQPLGWPQVLARSAPTRFCRTWLEAYGSRWPDELGEVPLLLIERMDELTDILSSAPLTLLHGDFHCQNMTFGADGILRLVDFQFVQQGAAMVDVARFLATSLTTATRRATEHGLLRRYHVRRAALGIPEPDPEVELITLRAALLWNLAMPLALRVMQIMTQDKSWPTCLPMLARGMAAARDWNAHAVLRSSRQ